jgi:Protein of unknown function (DUF3108)
VTQPAQTLTVAMPSVPHPRRWRRVGWWALLGAVILGHGLATLWLQQNLVDWGEGDKPMPPRMEVAFVRELAPAAPPAPPAASARAKPRPVKAKATARPASAPERAAPELPPETPPVAEVQSAPPPALPELAAAAEPPVAAVAAVTEPPAAVSAPASAPTSNVAPFEWPPSTRLTYRLSGNYRGEVHGNARVQWVRQGAHYQVHLDVFIGPSFAPLISRRMTSDGELGAEGLVPRRYDEATRLPFQEARRASVLFTPEQVTLGNGSQLETLPGVQDAASQFVQMTWLFTTQPETLRAGNVVTMPLALPRRMGKWVYDVLGEERIATPMGELATFHLKPRLGERRPGNELSAEVWFAPSLQYLPVRIRIMQDAETYLDLVIDAPPLQAAPEAQR